MYEVTNTRRHVAQTGWEAFPRGRAEGTDRVRGANVGLDSRASASIH